MLKRELLFLHILLFFRSYDFLPFYDLFCQCATKKMHLILFARVMAKKNGVPSFFSSDLRSKWINYLLLLTRIDDFDKFPSLSVTHIVMLKF